MKVIAAVNGQVSSEVAALYALRYAKLFGFTLTLLHVRNPTDSRYDVEESMASIEQTGGEYGVNVKRKFLNGDPVEAIRDFLTDSRADILFCSTRPSKHFFENTFSEKLAGIALPVDLAVIRVANIDMAYRVKTMVLPIRKDRLAVSKFAFFSSMIRAYDAAAEIYSITLVSRRRMAGLDVPVIKVLLSKINLRLAHYVKLSQLMNVSLRLRHAIAENEVDQILHHLSHYNFQLMIIDGERLTSFSRFFGNQPIERLFRYTPVNTIAYYARGKE